MLPAIGALWLATLAFFWPLITPNQGGRRWFGPGDFWLQFVPWHTFAARQLAAGRLALWDPYMYSGHPFQADVQTAVAYPIAAFNEWLGGRAFSFLQLEWEAIVHFGLAATFSFLLVRLLTGSTWAGLLGAVTFTFGGFLTSYPSQQLPVLESTTWLPLEIYCLERAARSFSSTPNSRPVTPWLCGAGASIGLAALAGHPQTILYLVYLGAAYFLFRLPWRAWWRAVWVALPAVGLSAIQLLPTLQLFAVNRRGGLDFGYAAGGIELTDLPALLLDQPSGGRILYLGLVPLALALVAIALVRSRQIAFWGATAVASLLLSLGTHGPLFQPVFDFLPGWNLFRDQERAVVWLALAGAILAGYGLKALNRMPAVVSALLVLAGFGNLWWANAGNNLTDVHPEVDAVSNFVQPVSSDSDVFRVRISEDSLGHNTGNLLGLQFVSGDSPFELQPFKDWAEDGPNGNRVTEWQLLRLTNSHYVISSRELCNSPCDEADGLRLIGSDVVPAGSRLLESQRGASAPSTELYLYQVLFPLPRAFFLTQAQPVTSQRQAMDVLNSPNFEAANTLLLQGPAAHSSPPDSTAQLHTDVTGYAAGFVEVHTSSDRPAYLYLSEVAYPDWQATIDGQPSPILTADGLFMALDVPAGDHRVVLQYVPKLFYVGAAISAVTLAVLACVSLWEKARERIPA
ncbi:MAG: YfhO family protein [Chloroflexi bacterium]|nr:YfhO family protein [Chloroflexota bacterium]